MRTRICLLALLLTAGCSGEKTGGGFQGSPTPPPPAGVQNPNPAPGTIVPDTDNTAFAQAVFTTGSTDTVVFSAALIGAAHDPNNPGANGTLPPPGYRFRAEFTYNDESETRRNVTLELATGNPPANPATLSVSSPPKRLSATDPDVRFTLGVIDLPPPAIGSVVEIVVPEARLTPTTGNVGYSLGFSNPSTAPFAQP